jgi:hypothetical protein
VFVAMLDAYRRLRDGGLQPGTTARRLADALPAGVLVVALLSIFVTPGSASPVREMFRAQMWTTSPEISRTMEILNMIPSNARVAASNRLGVQLTGRCDVYLFPAYPRPEFKPEWAVVIDNDISPLPLADMKQRRAEMGALGYTVVIADDGVTLYRLTAV